MMKKVFVVLLLLMGLGTYSSAQSSTEVIYLPDGSVIRRYTYTDEVVEAVYLKNGSIIRGMIIEQVPNVSLKIKTADGSVFAYPMSEVVKITKEQVQDSRQPWNNEKYRGFADLGYAVGVGDFETNRIELSASYGYQFNPHIFLGLGAALDYYADADISSIPMFVHFRANLLKTRITPFGDIKLGYTAGEITGLYMTMGLGARFALTKKWALNLRLEYSYQGDAQYEWFEHTNSSLKQENLTFQGIGIKAGFEF